MSWLLWCGIAGPVLFVVGFLYFGWKRPGYHPVYTFASQLALNGGGWQWQVVNCFSGALIAAFGFGLCAGLTRDVESALGASAIVLAGVGIVIFGISRDDPWLLYPPNLAPPWLGRPQTPNGWGHQVGALVAGAGLLAAHLIFAWRFALEGDPCGYGYSVATAIAFPVLYAFAIASGFASGHPGPVGGKAGLLQKVAMTTSLAWVALLAVRYLWPAMTLPG